MLESSEYGSVTFHENKSWVVTSSPNTKHIYCEVFLKPVLGCVLDEFDVGFSSEPNVCANTTAKYQPAMFQNHMYRVANGRYYLCLFNRTTGIGYPVHESPFLLIDIEFAPAAFSLPIWLFVVLVILLQTGAGMCSGLNLGLLSLDLPELRILMEAGNPNERRYAKIVYHLRSKGNALLVAIVLSNSAFNAVNTVVLESRLKGIGAAIVSTVMVTVLGEVVPQAVFSRFSLAVGAMTSWVTRTLLLVTFPFSWPLGKLLDRILGTDLPSSYPREKVQVLLQEQIPGVKDYETKMINGLLDLQSKRVEDYMKKIDDAFMIDADHIYDESLFMQLCDSGYSRIPIYRTNRNTSGATLIINVQNRYNVIGVLHIKDLSYFGDFGLYTVGEVCKKFNLPFVRCNTDTSMNVLLFNLKEKALGKANKAHMVLVEDENQKVIGMITIEDIMEEMLTFEILDEFDESDEEKKTQFTNSSLLGYGRRGFSAKLRNSAVGLMATLEPFNQAHISRDSLNRLIEQCYKTTLNGSKTFFYKRDVPADYFILIVKGKAVLEVGEEKLTFDALPLSHYGVNALLPKHSKDAKRRSFQVRPVFEPYKPEFTLYTTETVGYIKVGKKEWMDARATPVSRHQSSPLHAETKKTDV